MARNVNNPQAASASNAPASNAPAPSVDAPAPQLSFDTTDVVNQVVNLFTGYVNDVTDPKFTAFVADLASDAAKLAFYKNDSSADPALVAEMEAAFEARAASLSHIPGLLASGRVNIFMGVAKNVFAGLVAFGASTLRQYATGFAASVNKQ